MPSPDLPGYIDLTVVDQGPYELVELAKTNLPIVLPGYQWRPLSPDAAMVESLALLVAYIGFRINRLPAVIFETLIARYGVAYDQGAAPTTTILVTVADVAGYTIPAGSRFRLPLGGDAAVVFALDVDAVIAPGETVSPAVAATGTAFTDIANGVVAGTALEFLGSHPAYQSSALATAPAAGRIAESSASWFDRGAARLQRLTEVLSAPSQFAAAAVELEPAVVRVAVFDRYDPASANTIAAKADLGHITLALAATGGAPLTAPQATALETALEDLARVELDVHLIDMTITSVEVDVIVERDTNYTVGEVTDNVRAALAAYLNPDTWDVTEATVWRFELVSIIDQAEGVRRVVTLTTPAADVALTGDAPLAEFLDTVASTITVVDP